MKQFVLIIAMAAACQAQLWSGVLSSSRAVDWTRAGFPGATLPDASWPLCMTLASGNIAGSTIATDMASCVSAHPSGSYIQLPASFTLTSQINYVAEGAANIVLRGTTTPTVITVQAGAISNCSAADGEPTPICINSTDTTYIESGNNIVGWSSGYSKGSNSITLASTSGITSAASTLIFMEQCNTGFTSTSPTAACTGTATDNNQLFICGDAYNSTGPSGCSIDGADTGYAERAQMEISYATNVSGNVVTLADPLMWPNWSVTANLQPRIWYAQPLIGVGIENVNLNLSAASGSGIVFMNVLNWWVSGCEIYNFSDYAVFPYQSEHGVMRDNYIHDSTGGDSYGARPFVSSQNIFQNNIIVRTFAPIVFDGSASGNIVSYNFITYDYQTGGGSFDFMRGSAFEHYVTYGDLYEGNDISSQWNDGDHGTTGMITRFRNFLRGWESCANGQCGTASAKDGWTNSGVDSYGDRYNNNVGNIAGTPNWHTTYKSNTGGLGGGDKLVVWTPGPSQQGIPIDPYVISTSMWWGNWDPATNSVRWCGSSGDTGWSAICGSTSEIPTTDPNYPNSLPTLGDTGAGQGALPSSFYLSSKPSWFGSLTYPPIGPDVSSGNVGQCTGILNTTGEFAGVAATSSAQCTGTSLASAWGGHVNAIPATNCYLNVLGGKPDGSGGTTTTFSANACGYNNSGSITPGAPAPSLFARLSHP